MTAVISVADVLLDGAAPRLERAGYRAIPWDRTDRAAIAAAAVRRAVSALRDGGETVIHPLGFARIPISPWALERPRIAVNVWSGDAWAAHALDIHDHCYDFASICLAGEIRHSFFEPSCSTDAHDYDALNYMAGCCAESESAPGEGQRLALVDEQTVVAHGALSVHHGRLHRAQPLTDLAVTVQFQSPCLKPIARVFRAADAGHHVSRGSSEHLSRERLVFLLESVVQ